MDLQARAYETLSQLLEQHTGQVLLANRHWRVEMALKPVMRNHSIPDIESLAPLLISNADTALTRQCIEAMINNESCFFRDQANFALMTGPVLDAIRERRNSNRTIRIWSSACSTGQEAYSIAMAISENAQKWAGWKIQIIATDVSQLALNQAREGRYSQFEIQRGLPVMMMVKYFQQVGEDWVVKDSLRKMITFSELNILKPVRHLGQFDLILCRNMLMYLCKDKRQQVLDQLSGSLANDGMLMLGAAETVIGQTDRLKASQEFRGFYELNINQSIAAVIRKVANN